VSKPLRRTAWTMLASGLAGTALMFGAGTFAVAGGAPAGPGDQATWPAGETVTLVRPLGEPPLDTLTVSCTVTPEDGPALRKPWLGVGEALSPSVPGAATVTCAERVVLLAGAPRVVADYTRGPLLAVPLFVAVLGGLLFVPRFTHTLATLSTRGWLRRMLRIPPPD
jgi:hypothetical protein